MEKEKREKKRVKNFREVVAWLTICSTLLSGCGSAILYASPDVNTSQNGGRNPNSNYNVDGLNTSVNYADQDYNGEHKYESEYKDAFYIPDDLCSEPEKMISFEVVDLIGDTAFMYVYQTRIYTETYEEAKERAEAKARADSTASDGSVLYEYDNSELEIERNLAEDRMATVLATYDYEKGAEYYHEILRFETSLTETQSIYCHPINDVFGVRENNWVDTTAYGLYFNGDVYFFDRTKLQDLAKKKASDIHGTVDVSFGCFGHVEEDSSDRATWGVGESINIARDALKEQVEALWTGMQVKMPEKGWNGQMEDISDVVFAGNENGVTVDIIMSYVPDQAANEPPEGSEDEGVDLNKAMFTATIKLIMYKITDAENICFVSYNTKYADTAYAFGTDPAEAYAGYNRDLGGLYDDCRNNLANLASSFLTAAQNVTPVFTRGECDWRFVEGYNYTVDKYLEDHYSSSSYSNNGVYLVDANGETPSLMTDSRLSGSVRESYYLLSQEIYADMRNSLKTELRKAGLYDDYVNVNSFKTVLSSAGQGSELYKRILLSLPRIYGTLQVQRVDYKQLRRREWLNYRYTQEEWNNAAAIQDSNQREQALSNLQNRSFEYHYEKPRKEYTYNAVYAKTVGYASGAVVFSCQYDFDGVNDGSQNYTTAVSVLNGVTLAFHNSEDKNDNGDVIWYYSKLYMDETALGSELIHNVVDRKPRFWNNYGDMTEEEIMEMMKESREEIFGSGVDLSQCTGGLLGQAMNRHHTYGLMRRMSSRNSDGHISEVEVRVIDGECYIYEKHEGHTYVFVMTVDDIVTYEDWHTYDWWYRWASEDAFDIESSKMNVSANYAVSEEDSAAQLAALRQALSGNMAMANMDEDLAQYSSLAEISQNNDVISKSVKYDGYTFLFGRDQIYIYNAQSRNIEPGLTYEQYGKILRSVSGADFVSETARSRKLEFISIINTNLYSRFVIYMDDPNGWRDTGSGYEINITISENSVSSDIVADASGNAVLSGNGVLGTLTLMATPNRDKYEYTYDFHWVAELPEGYTDNIDKNMYRDSIINRAEEFFGQFLPDLKPEPTTEKAEDARANYGAWEVSPPMGLYSLYSLTPWVVTSPDTGFELAGGNNGKPYIPIFQKYAVYERDTHITYRNEEGTSISAQTVSQNYRQMMYLDEGVSPYMCLRNGGSDKADYPYIMIGYDYQGAVYSQIDLARAKVIPFRLVPPNMFYEGCHLQASANERLIYLLKNEYTQDVLDGATPQEGYVAAHNIGEPLLRFVDMASNATVSGNYTISGNYTVSGNSGR